jgi:hypothetical protein
MKCGAAAEQHRHAVAQLLLRHQEAIFGWPLDGVAERADAARDDRYFAHRVLPRQRARRILLFKRQASISGRLEVVQLPQFAGASRHVAPR